MPGVRLVTFQGAVKVIDFDDCGFSWYMYDAATPVSFYEHEPQVPELIEHSGVHPDGDQLPRLIAEAFAGRRARRHETAAPPIRDSAAPSPVSSQLPFDATSTSAPTPDQPSE